MQTTAQLERVSPLAGKPAPREMLVDIGRLDREYYARKPDVGDPTQRVAFGTSGHRGSPFSASFTEAHILAITQAICDAPSYRGSGALGTDKGSSSSPATPPPRNPGSVSV
jgi:phosphoglucomutase